MRLFLVVALFAACARADLYASIGTGSGALTSSCTVSLPAGTGTLKVVHCANLLGDQIGAGIVVNPPIPANYEFTPPAIELFGEVSVDPPTVASCSLQTFAITGAKGGGTLQVKEEGLVTVAKLPPLGYLVTLNVQCIVSTASPTTTTAKVPTPPPTPPPVSAPRAQHTATALTPTQSGPTPPTPPPTTKAPTPPPPPTPPGATTTKAPPATTTGPPGATTKSNTTTFLIIGGVVALLVCCCCCILLAIGAFVLMRKKGQQGGSRTLQTELPASVTTFKELARYTESGYAPGIHHRAGTIVA